MNPAICICILIHTHTYITITFKGKRNHGFERELGNVEGVEWEEGEKGWNVVNVLWIHEILKREGIRVIFISTQKAHNFHPRGSHLSKALSPHHLSIILCTWDQNCSMGPWEAFLMQTMASIRYDVLCQIRFGLTVSISWKLYSNH